MVKRSLWSNNDTTHRCTQALGETQTDGVKVRAEFGQGPRTGDDGFPETGAVAVHADVVGFGECGNASYFGQGHDHAVEGVFEADDARGTGVDVGAEDDVGLDVFEGEVDAVGGDDGRGHCAGEGGYTRLLVTTE